MRIQTEKSAQELRQRGASLGNGGEATIHAVPEDPKLAAKIYHRPTEEHAAKLAAMLTAPPADPMAGSGHVSIAWPTELLFADGKVAGYLMPRVHLARLIQEFYNPRARQQTCPRFHYGYLLRTARNLASAVRAIHDRGYVIGDVNESNILVTNQALVTLVDTDSFQVPAPERTFRCRVGKPEYTPPELQGARFADIDRGPEHDAFGLAVLIFQLLMQGVHPFAGLYKEMGEPATIPQRIAAGHWPYLGSSVPYRPSPHAPPFHVLPTPVQELMRRCFADGQRRPQRRPTALEWHRALQEAEKAIVTCAANPQHVYQGSLPECPWCVLAGQQGRDPFPATEVTRTRPATNGVVTKPTLKERKKTVVAASPPTPYARPAYPVAQPASPPTRFKAATFLLAAVVALVMVGAGFLGWSFTHDGQRSETPEAKVPVSVAETPPLKEMPYLPVRRFEGHTGRITSVALSADGKRMLSGSADLTIRLWDVSNGKELQRFVGHTNWIKGLAFTPDGRRFVSAGFDKTVRLWDIDTGKQISNLSSHLDQVMSVAVSNDGRLALSGSYDETIRMWDLRETWQQRHWWLRDLVNSVALSPDGRQALCAGSDRGFRLWDIMNGKEVRRFTGHTGVVNSVAFSGDGQRALSGSADDSVRLWDIASGQELQRCSGHQEEVTAVAFAGDGRRLVSGSSDNTVRLWDAGTGRELRCFKADVLGVTSVAVRGDLVVAGGGDSSIHLWSLAPTTTR